MQRQSTTFDLKSLSKTLKPITNKLLGKHGLVEIDLITNWKSIAGEEIGSYSLPQSIRFAKNEKNNGTLIVAVKSSAFSLEINAKKNVIIDKINTFFGFSLIKDLKTIVADIPTSNVELYEKTLVSQIDDLYIKDKTKEIKSEKLKQALEKLGAGIIRKTK